jgi:hypothetical protein
MKQVLFLPSVLCLHRYVNQRYLTVEPKQNLRGHCAVELHDYIALRTSDKWAHTNGHLPGLARDGHPCVQVGSRGMAADEECLVVYEDNNLAKMTSAQAKNQLAAWAPSPLCLCHCVHACVRACVCALSLSLTHTHTRARAGVSRAVEVEREKVKQALLDVCGEDHDRRHRLAEIYASAVEDSHHDSGADEPVAVSCCE